MVQKSLPVCNHASPLSHRNSTSVVMLAVGDFWLYAMRSFCCSSFVDPDPPSCHSMCVHVNILLC